MPKRKLALFLMMFISAIHLMCADSLYASERSDAEACYLDPTKTCSLTVHAYVHQDGGESPGTWNEGQEVMPDAVPLKGAVYSYLKIGDITQLITDYTAGVYIHHVNEDFLHLLTDRSGTAMEGITENGETFYTIGALQEALYSLLVDKSGVKNDQSAPSAQGDRDLMTGEDALTSFVAEKGTAMQATDVDGTSRAEGLPHGLFLLAETELPDDDNREFFSGAAPSFLMLPQMDVTKFTEDGSLKESDSIWLYDISVYPKNRALENGKKIILADNGSACADADARESGSTVAFVSYIDLPVSGEGSGYDYISMADTMTDGLAYAGMTGIYYGPWLPEEDMAHAAQRCQGELLPDSDYMVTEEDHSFSVELTPEGLNKVNSLGVNGGIYVCYDALVTRDAYIGTSGANLNESSWTISTDRTSQDYSPAPARASVTVYGLDLLKKGLPDPSKARFEVRRDKQLLYFTLLSDGTYMVTGKESDRSAAFTSSTAAGESVSTLSPGPDGHLLILGLDRSTYTLREIGTDEGYSLLPSSLDITLTASPVMNGSLEKAELVIEGSEPVTLSLSAENAGIAEFTISNEGVITPLVAGDDDYWKVAVFVALFGTLLLIALLVRRHKINCDSDETQSH